MQAFSMDAYFDLVGRDEPVEERDLFATLGKVQDAFGRIPRSVIEDLARRSGVGEARVWGALTAYPDFVVGDGEE